MASGIPSRPSDIIRHELEALKAEWYWFLALGALLIVAGMVAISYAFLATAVAVTMFGFLLVICGGAQIVSSFWAGKWSGFLLALLAGVLYVVVGGMVVARPLQASLALTLLIGAFFLVGGVFRSVAALALRMHHWGWLLLNGVVTTVLGMIVLADWPEDSLQLIGLFLGIDMIFNGWTWVMLGLGLRNLPPAASQPS